MAASQAGVSIASKEEDSKANKEKEEAMSIVKVEAKSTAMSTMAASKANIEDNSNNLEQRERGRSKWQCKDKSKDVLEKEIEEMWQLMMQQFKWRKMVATRRMINQSLNLIDKKKNMEQKTAKVQQQQGNKACG